MYIVVCEGGVTVKLWTSKSKLSPVKEILIPRYVGMSVVGMSSVKQVDCIGENCGGE